MIEHSSLLNRSDRHIPTELLENVFENLNSVVFEREMTGSRHYTFISENCEEILGYSSEDFYANPNLTEEALINDKTFSGLYEHDPYEGKECHVMEFAFCGKDGQVRYLRSIFRSIFDNGILIKYRGIVFNIAEEARNVMRLHKELKENELLEEIVTERTKALNELISMQNKLETLNDELLFSATHDSLTREGNREMLTECLKKAQLKKEQIALILVDLKRFKRINDSLGHAAGDEIIISAAHRIKCCIKKNGILVRFSGDKFAIVISFHKKHHRERNSYYLYKIIDRLHRSFEPAFTLHDKSITIDINIGASFSQSDDFVAGDLLRFSEITLRQAKEQRISQVASFRPGQIYLLEHQLDQEIKVREALKNHDIVVWYQPIVDMRTQKIIGAEALARWEHPELGLLAAEQFMPTVEEADLLSVLADILPKQVIQFRKEIHCLVDTMFCIKMNLDAMSFTHHCIQKVINMIDQEACDPKGLGFEITESNAMHNISESIVIMKYLKTLGIRVDIDDFGTGFSDLSRLFDLPISGLKLDRSFISDVIKKDTARALVASIVSLTSQLNLQLIAESIETETQRQQLLSLGVKEGQGFLWSPALPPYEFKQLLRNT